MFSLPRSTPQQQAAADAKLWQKRESERLSLQAAQDAEELELDHVSEKRKLRDQDPIAQCPTKFGGQNLKIIQQRVEVAVEQVDAQAAEKPPPNSTVELTKATTNNGEKFRLAVIHSTSKPEWDTARHVIQYIEYYITNTIHKRFLPKHHGFAQLSARRLLA
jgi:hypothetical protein